MTAPALFRLSIIIPTYDTAAMTRRCCEAVLAAMPAGSEVIVVDDGSRDETATSMPDGVRVLRLERNCGFAVAANRGVSEARGEIVLLLNSDAIPEQGALDAFVRAFDDERLGVAGARLLNDDGTPQWSGGRTPTLAWMIGVVSGAGALARFFRRDKPDAQRKVDWVSGAAMAFRREVWRDAGPLNERYHFYCQDIELCLRARAANWDVRVIEDARVRHGLGGTIADGDALRHDASRLWPDLLTWGCAHYGKRWAAFARVALVGVAALRVIGNRRLLPALRALVQSEA